MSAKQPEIETGQQPSTQLLAVEVLIVSGRSGSGKTSVLNILEDLGYYVIDNMPLSLLPAAAEKLTAEGGIKQLVHPLMAMSSYDVKNLPSAIKKETETLQSIASNADITIDTSSLNIHQLKELVREYIGADNQITVNLLSFGFKFGVPIDADFVFDVRILPNPHWNPELRVKTGRDIEVAEFFSEFPEVDEMQQDIYQFLNRWLPEFLHNNRHTVTVAIGCTGGKHRSVFITEKLYARLSQSLPSELKAMIKHREKLHWGH